jgi:hypothetical protein
MNAVAKRPETEAPRGFLQREGDTGVLAVRRGA